MLCVNGDNTVQRLGDSVNAEDLVCRGVIRLRLDKSLFAYFRIECPRNRVFHNALIGTVSLFADLAGDRIGKSANAEGGEVCCIRFVKNGNHTITHLGITSMLVMPPSKEMAFAPGRKMGNPSPLTVSFFGVASW